MNRLTLSGQVALIVAVALFLVQFVNLGMALDHRRELAIEQTIAPAAHRLALAAEQPGLSERRFEDLAGDRAPDHHRPRGLPPRLSNDNPVPPRAERYPSVEKILRERLEETGVDVQDVRAAAPRRARPGDGNRAMLLAVQLEDGRWLTVRAPGPPSMRPLIAMLMLQSLLIGLAILIPALLLLRKVGGSLGRLRDNALAFDGAAPGDPVEPAGPSDIRALISAVNAMQARIATMLGEKDVMLGAIGHDLRTPLTALRLEAEAVADPGQRETLIAQVEALHGQFEQILDFARSGRAATHRDLRELAPLVEEVAARHPGVVLGSLAPLRAHVDGAAIQRALSNLVENGLRHAKDVSLSLEVEAGKALLVVADRGPGLSDAEKEIARTPFGRLDASRNRSSGGHGLGLAIVEAISRAHGGELRLDDNRPGLRAVIAIPLA